MSARGDLLTIHMVGGRQAIRKSTGVWLPRSTIETRRKSMIRTITIAAVSAAVVLTLSLIAFAQQTGGTADEAKAMLVKAVATVRANQTKALDMFNKGEGGFLDRDLYVFCFDISDGKVVASQVKQALGQDIRGAKDSTGRLFGPELYAGAKEGQITEVGPYLVPRPSADRTEVQKVSFVTRVGDLGCGVGYYK
jgi:signal transduction histidine kinase